MYILTVNLQCIISFWSNPTLQHIFEKCCLVHLADTYVPKEKSLSISLKKKEKKSTTFDWHVEADCLQSKRQTRRSMLKKKKNQFTAFYLQNTCIITCITQNWSDPKRKMEKKKLQRSISNLNKHSQNSWLIHFQYMRSKALQIWLNISVIKHCNHRYI